MVECSSCKGKDVHYTSAGNLAIDEDLLENHLSYEDYKKIGELTKEIMDAHPGELPEKFGYKGTNAYTSRGRVVHALEDMSIKGKVLIEPHPTRVKLAGTQEEQIHAVEHEGLERLIENTIRKIRDSRHRVPTTSTADKSIIIDRLQSEYDLNRKKAFVEAYYAVMDDSNVADAVKEGVVEEFKNDEDLK